MSHVFFGRNYKIVSRFGMRVHPIHKTQILHTGIDFAMPIGTIVNAIADGFVIESRKSISYGNRIVILHTKGPCSGYSTSYNHLNGENVIRGQKIGLSGNTGTSAGPHLHFEVYKPGLPVYSGNFVNHDTVVDPEKYWDLLERDIAL